MCEESKHTRMLEIDFEEMIFVVNVEAVLNSRFSLCIKLCFKGKGSAAGKLMKEQNRFKII